MTRIFKTFYSMIFCFVLVCSSSAQTKKEQISFLQLRIDSLFDVLEQTRLQLNDSQNQLKDKISSSTETETRLNAELSTKSKKLQELTEKNGKINSQLTQLNDSLVKVNNRAKDYANQLASLIVENNRLKDSLERQNSDLNFSKNEDPVFQSNLDSVNDSLDTKSKSLIIYELIFVEGGTFLMGSVDGKALQWRENNKLISIDSSPVHPVTLSSFHIGKYEVTHKLWREVMGSAPNNSDLCDNCPINGVSWNQVQQFIQKLNSLTGKNYRLPTEAEWEYAAKGGKQSKGYIYSGSNDWGSVAWTFKNNGGKIHAVGGKQANELGINDMSGNVNEYCSDWFNSYARDSQINPLGASTGFGKVVRGGGIYQSEIHVYDRGGFIRPDSTHDAPGFRLVLPVNQ